MYESGGLAKVVEDNDEDEEAQPPMAKTVTLMESISRTDSKDGEKSPKKPQGGKIKPRTRREMQSETAGKFAFPDFQVLMEFLRQSREKSVAEEQRRLAEELGLLAEDNRAWVSSKLFLEFRHELKRCHDLFVRFDEDFSGYLELNEIWEALMSLGLMPKVHQDKVSILQLVSEACESTLRSELRSKRRFGGLGLALMFLYTQMGHDSGVADVLHKHLSQDQATLLQSQIAQNQRINFKDFLLLLSKVRSWHHQTMRDELMPLFEKRLKRRIATGAVLSIPEVCKALEDLKLAPNNLEEQEKIKELLEKSNEWGFDPPCLDFEGFVHFIRQMREWSKSVRRSTENEYGWKTFQYDERKVNMYRMAFDILDTEGDDQLGITSVRKVFVLLRRAITSDNLRELFAKIDLDGSGTIGFLEFLHLVYELDQGRWGHQKETEGESDGEGEKQEEEVSSPKKTNRRGTLDFDENHGTLFRTNSGDLCASRIDD